ncbi:GNAT family N-acetyltransferase [Natronoarchaeum rubrum]|uniref:GNAT family N-acetyltransferase n=1 Tax=Natronoarchaeum rubrum TaxID=755311 RepID=UPI002112444E|nr:GNAT family N-acetyltransferase [Natronoarchaeum rubrum]
MTDDPTIRRYQPGDEAALRELQRVALTDAGAYFGEGAVDEDLGRVESVYLDAGGEFLVAEVDGNIVGSGALRRPSEIVDGLSDNVDAVAELKRFYVHPEYHRRGIGRALYDELERHARDRGREVLVLETTARQTPARRFYESRGFEERRRESGEAEGERYEVLTYRKVL